MNKMTNEDKRKIVEFVGLCWHEGKFEKHRIDEEILVCSKCGKKTRCLFIQLDPLSPADMYGKIWVAFKEMGELYEHFCSEIYSKGHKLDSWWDYDLLTSAPDLAQALLEYINSKEKKDA